MERYSSRTIDELGRFVLHSELRKKLGLAMKGRVSLKLVGSIIILRQAEGIAGDDCAFSEIDEIGMVTLPSEVMKDMSWKSGDKIAFYNTDNLIFLKTAG